MPQEEHTIYTPHQCPGGRTYRVEHHPYGISVYFGEKEVFLDLYPEEGVQIKVRDNPEEGGDFDLIETFYEE